MILIFWMLSFNPTFSFSIFTLIKKFFSSSSLSTIRVIWSAYLRLLIFLPTIWFHLVIYPVHHFIQKTKIMASSPITSRQIDGETTETMTDFIFLVSKITVEVDFSHEIKRHLPLGRKAMTNLDSILRSRDITLPTKIHLVKAMVFPTVMYKCESWTTKKAEHQRIDAFELWCWRRLLRVSWTARRSNQSILKEISPEYSL